LIGEIVDVTGWLGGITDVEHADKSSAESSAADEDCRPVTDHPSSTPQ
jgi:hypothetical protein